MAGKFDTLLSTVKPMLDDYARFLPLVRSTTMLSEDDKKEVLGLCKSLPKQLHDLLPSRSVQVKTFMIYFQVHDFIEKWGTIGLFNEDPFESRHARRNAFKRRYACIRAAAARDRAIAIAYSSLLATRKMRTEAIEKTCRKKAKDLRVRRLRARHDI